MKIQKCYCDYCKEEIKSAEFLANFNGVNVLFNNNGKLEKLDEPAKHGQLEDSLGEILKFCSKDFHIDCLKRFLEEINFNLSLDEPSFERENEDDKIIENTEPSTVVEEEKPTNNEVTGGGDESKDNKEEKEQDDPLIREEKIKKYEESLKNNEKKVDVGKLIALRNARWSADKIAEELEISKPYVFKILQKLRELGDTRLKV